MWYTPAPYSWIKVNVGLETSSGVAAPRPCAIPFASVVLPAPRLPISRTTPRLGSSPARRSPSAIVSSSELVRYVGTFLHRFRKVLQNVGRHQTLLPVRLRAEFARSPVQVNGGGDRLIRTLRELRE